MIAIIDYGAGNLKSVKKAFDYLNVANKIIHSFEELNGCDRIVLPGVGAFGAAVEKLKASGFFEYIGKWIEASKPFLGICLGMQLLMQNSSESAAVTGLSVFRGDCKRFQSGKVPQIGWNQIHIQKESPLFSGIPDGSFFYFLHGYYISPIDEEIILARTDYRIKYPSIVEKDRTIAVQFHPEKSGDLGIRLLKNWVELC